jgi:hypothetical protein
VAQITETHITETDITLEQITITQTAIKQILGNFLIILAKKRTYSIKPKSSNKLGGPE